MPLNALNHSAAGRPQYGARACGGAVAACTENATKKRDEKRERDATSRLQTACRLHAFVCIAKCGFLLLLL